MIKNLKRELYFLFASSIMLVFTSVFFLLASENIKTMQNAELNFVNRQATNLILIFKSSTNYAENLGTCEKKYDYTFRSVNGRTYYGILCSIYASDGYLNLAIVKEKSGITTFSSTVMHYFLIWLIVLIAVLFVSVLIIRQAIKPTE